MSSQTLQLTDALRAYLRDRGMVEPPLLQRLREETASLEQARMQISPEQGAFMGVLVQLLGVQRALEIGTFTGYSSLAMALAMPEDGRIVCCDVSEEWTSMARRYWEEAGVSDRVALRIGPATDTLDTLLAEGGAESFDLAFVDADKESYLAYHERCVQLVRPGGALLYDNVLWGGSVVDPDDHRETTAAIRALNDRVARDDRVRHVILPIGDGLTLAVKH